MTPFCWTSAALYHRLWFGAGGRLVTYLGYGWNDGGCLQLAQALVQVLGNGASIHLIRCRQHWWCHAVASQHGWYLDGDGIATPQQLLLRWENEEGHPSAWLSSFDATLVNDETPDDPLIISALIVVLTASCEE